MGNGGLVLFLSLIFLSPLLSYAQSEICGPGTVESPSTHQCVPACGEGTEFNGTICIESNPAWYELVFTEFYLLAIGVIIGVFATAYGIWRSQKTRNEELKKEDMEVIQKYGEQLAEIQNAEGELETKLDCSLYAEKYLDTLEQIATLNYKNILRKEVVDYFENHFMYGRHLWEWYKKNVEHIPEELLEDHWLERENEDERWYNFRFWYEYDGYIEDIGDAYVRQK